MFPMAPTGVSNKFRVFQVFSKIVMDYEPTYSSATGDVYDLMKDPVITPKEKLTLQAEAHDCEDRWDALNDKVKLRVDRCASRHHVIRPGYTRRAHKRNYRNNLYVLPPDDVLSKCQELIVWFSCAPVAPLSRTW